MKRRMWLVGALAALLWATPAKAAGVIVRTTGGLQALQALCLLPTTCTIVTSLDGTLGQVYLVTTPLPLQTFLGLLPTGLTGFVDAEVNQLLSLVDLTQLVPAIIPSTLMQDRSSSFYPAGSTTPAWNSYINQPAASIVGLQNAQNTFNVTGTGIVADIDTGVDPTHPALQGVLLPGYDFTRNQPGGSELNDIASSPCPFASCPPPPCPTCSPVKVNQSTAAVLDQSTAAVLDGTPYAAFGHGTMVMGIIHLVAPTAQLMPLKAFHSDGTASLSDILRAIYYGVQNGANVINMSFDTKTSSAELQKALDYVNQQGVICAASSGNDGQGPPASPILVYPAALQSDVMGVASTSDQDTRSSFSNYGSAIVWVAAPGEAIVSTYPYNTYAAGWGTSFSAPFVSGAAALLRNRHANINESTAAAAVAHAVPIGPDLGHGRLDLVQALQAIPVATGNDFDGDGKADIGIFRPSAGTWFIIPSSSPSAPILLQWGTQGDIPVPGDYDGDGKTDFAVWRPSNGTWYVIPSSNPSAMIVQQWGLSGDIPVPGDYDGDGKTDFAVWRPSNGTWYVIPSKTPSNFLVQQWGLSGDIPVLGDYDGDGKTDFAVWRPSDGTWYVIPSKTPNNFLVQQWGVTGDIPVPGDYDGDGKTDFAVWRPSNGTWYVIPSKTPSNFLVQQWGVSTDIPTPVDYDGDRKTDFAVWRPSNGTWYVIPSSAPTNYAVTQWGMSTDVPLQKPIGQ